MGSNNEKKVNISPKIKKLFKKKLNLDKKIKKEHGRKWNKISHWGQCGQSCPCCRWKIGQEIFGSCEICKKYLN